MITYWRSGEAICTRNSPGGNWKRSPTGVQVRPFVQETLPEVSVKRECGVVSTSFRFHFVKCVLQLHAGVVSVSGISWSLEYQNFSIHDSDCITAACRSSVCQQHKLVAGISKLQHSRLGLYYSCMHASPHATQLTLYRYKGVLRYNLIYLNT